MVAGWQEVLACFAWKSEQRLRERGDGAAMSLATWAAGHASIGIGDGPLARVLCSFGGMGCPRDCSMEAVVVVYRRKSRPTWLVSAMATLSGAVFLLGGIAVESRLPSVHHSRVKTQIRLAGLDDGSVYGRRVLLGGVTFGVLGVALGGALATGWFDVFRFRRCASDTGFASSACPLHEA
jgi:hypothetical protein